MFHFGFSYVGFIYLLMLFIPNIIWMKHKPVNYEEYSKNESKVLQVIEKIGEILVCCCALIFSDFNIKYNSIWCIWLVGSFVLMVLYEIYWIRYFRSKKEMTDFYKSICGFPVAGATLPVCAFILLGVYGGNVFLIVSTIILGIGHIGIHVEHYKSISRDIKKKSLIIRIIKWTIRIIILLLLGIAIIIIGFRNFNYIGAYIDNEQGVNEGIYVPLEGQEQYLLIQGKDTSNPVIIWLHGGPSSPDAFVNYIFQKHLVDDYTIINWDQRGCGRTYFNNADVDASNETASFGQAQADLNALVDYACTRFNVEKVIIVGHSYGTMLGSQYVLNYPEKVSAYIGVGQVVTIESDVYSYEDALQRAIAIGDDTQEMEAAYQKYIEDSSLINMMNLRNYTSNYHMAEKTANTIWEGITSPYMGIEDVRWFLLQAGNLEKYISLNGQLFDYIMETDVRDYGLEYQVPVGFITGSDDWTTPSKYAEDYYNIISAPQKQFSLVEGCGHAPQYDSPEEFCSILKSMLTEITK